MAENENGQEKTEQPTPKKLQDAKQKGQVPRSVDFNTTVMTIAAGSALLALGPGILSDVSSNFSKSFVLGKSQLFDSSAMLAMFESIVLSTLASVAPFLLLMLLVAIIAPGVLGGWVFTFENLAPKFSKLDPFKGIARIFSIKGLMELIKSLLKVIVVGSIAYLLFNQLFEQFLSMAFKPLVPSMVDVAGAMVWSLIAMACGMVLIAAIDAPFQVWQYRKQLRMTRQEVKDEMRDTDGKPEVKAKIRNLQQQMANARMMDEVPSADVVITNPTHFSVALRYDQETMHAPVLIAKGTGLIALRIREIARENSIEIVESPPLARALFASTDLNQEIPSPLYVAVAQVLGFVFQLRLAQKNGTTKPKRPRPEVPDDFLAAYDIRVDDEGNVEESDDI